MTVAREWDHLASDAAYLASDAFVRSNAMLRALITDGPVRRRSHAELLAADDTLIAHEMGYGSLSAVNAAFRELAHTTPSGYRVMYTG
ncbi:MAG: hypothetical protein ABIU87_07580 [Ornithinibacter sp.]